MASGADTHTHTYIRTEVISINQARAWFNNVIIFAVYTPKRKTRYKFIEALLVGCSHYHCILAQLFMASTLKDREIVSQVCTVFGACTKIQSCFAFISVGRTSTNYSGSKDRQTSVIIVDI